MGVIPSVTVAPDARSGDLVISVTPGGTLKLLYDGAKPQVFVAIKSRGAPVGFPEPVESGKAFEKRAPQGALVLEIRLEWQGEPRTIQVDLAAGETKEVVIHDEK